MNGPGTPMVDRRTVVKLLGLAAAGFAVGGVATCDGPRGVSEKDAGAAGAVRYSYGWHERQVGDLFLPQGAKRDGAGPLPLAVMIHGGGWSGFSTAASTGHMAADLARRGMAVWNIEYRGSGRGGGWPHTYVDVAAAMDHVPKLAGQADVEIDLDRVTVTGVSAGGNLAAWAAGRTMLPPEIPGSRPKFPVRNCVAICGVYDLAKAFRAGDKHIVPLLGGPPEAYPDRYRDASPVFHVDPGVRMSVLHGRNDRTVSFEQATVYADAARAAGNPVDLRILHDADHGSWGKIHGAPWALAKKAIAGQLGLSA
ncbi:alpha/beta hydrolase family protein [Corynebacterium hansenii]|uniref:Alpha/beta hydrolase family protein n=1 Tax=Corynebacterium hansenii TaxID=394964 RepID=A0ABV7ZMG2_9CORY|nr:prolyl oligopeptidase family serine peptidase [Corynebacterium hansenii]WJY98722.1 Prolyl oligopeptidase family protein [Corynebacterium hansenii]